MLFYYCESSGSHTNLEKPDFLYSYHIINEIMNYFL